MALVGVDEIQPLLEPAVAALESDVGALLRGRSISSDLLEPLRGDVELEEVLLLDLQRACSSTSMRSRSVVHDVELTLRGR